jgi:hypothetical protein
MRKRQWFVALACLAVLVAVGMLFVLWPRQDRITQENLYRIYEGMNRPEGMSRPEVEAILGPPGDYTSRPTISGVNLHTRATEPGSPQYWGGDHFTIAVAFTSQDKKVAGISGWRAVVSNADQTALDNFIWRIERRWQECFP